MEKDSSILHKFDQAGQKQSGSHSFVPILIVIIILGVVVGYIISTTKSNIGNKSINTSISSSSEIKKGDVFGTDDTKTFKDTAEGVLKEGGIDGEGQYHLERPGGESQYVYMTSSVIDLGKLKNRKIKVWGQTQKAQKAGWLMDVGKVEVLE